MSDTDVPLELALYDPLTQLAWRHGTDKLTHGYCPHYHRRFAELRERPVRLLEIGVGGYAAPDAGGESLRMWRDYFRHPDALIVGLDVAEKNADLAPGCVIERGDQSDPRDLNRIGETYGPFDIVVDDGSHIPDDALQSWVVLWTSYLADDGWYVVEDLQTSYWPPFGGSSVRTGDSLIGWLCGLIDRIHYAELDIPGYNPNRFDLTVVGMEIARNIVFLRRGDNGAPSNIMPAHPHPQQWPPDDDAT